MSSKLDIFIINQDNLRRSIIPERKIINRSNKIPPLHINTFELDMMENFLANNSNLTAAVSTIYFHTLLLSISFDKPLEEFLL